MDNSNTALVVRVPDGHAPRLSKENISMPAPAPNQVLVRISHVAQNPTDVQSFDRNAFGDGAVLGCDFVGEVAEVGSSVTRYVKGDTVAGLVWGGEIKYLGAYSQYCLADERVSFPVPANVTREQASTVPLAAATAWLALFSKDCLGIDRKQAKGTSVLVWGGSSSVGLYSIQLASICGLNVITTCSPKHADLVSRYGAKYVFDYKDPKTIEKIRSAVPGLKHVFDTIGSPTSTADASHCFGGETGNQFCTVRPGKTHAESVPRGTRVEDVLVWTAFLKDHSYGDFKWLASKEDHELASELFEKLPAWIEESTVKPNTPKVLKGLEAVADGFQEYRDGKISAYKIVYEL